MTDTSPPIRVLIAAGTAVNRIALMDILSFDNAIAIAGLACDVDATLRRLAGGTVDIVLLDSSNDANDAIAFLRRVGTPPSVPIVVVLSESNQTVRIASTARELGARGFYFKPSSYDEKTMAMHVPILCGLIRNAVGRPPADFIPIGKEESPETETNGANLGERIEKRLGNLNLSEPPKKLSADVILPIPTLQVPVLHTDRLVCIGASTGGTESLRDMLRTLPENSPGIVVVQHMPKHFTASFARHLDSYCAVAVHEAQDGEPVVRGQVLIAPGDRHILISRTGTHYVVKLVDGPPVSRHRPSVDVLFRSAAIEAGANATGVLLTGMGDDGAHGLLEMKTAGAYTIAQDEATSIVFGMPKVAIQKGAAMRVLPLHQISQELMNADRR